VGTTLVIAEKPSVAKEIAAALPGNFARKDGYLEAPDWIVSYAVGHLAGLKSPEDYDPALAKWQASTLPIVPAPFALKPVSQKARAQLKVLWALLQLPEVELVINACDAGREGELIFAYLMELTGATGKHPVQRLWISSMTAEAIRDGFAKLRDGATMAPLEDAARCRSEADWLVGLNATRAATLRARGHLEGVVSLGRVQTPTLALIVRRDLEIAAHTAHGYRLVRAQFALAAPLSGSYSGLHLSAAGSTRIEDATKAEQIVQAVSGRPGRVASLDCKRSSERCPLLYDLTSLQRDANKRHGFSAARTLQAAQALYEQRTALTYPRTDSRYLTADMKPQLKQVARSLEGFSEYAVAVAVVVALAKIPARIVDDKKVTDHHAIIPTPVPHDRGGWSDDERKVFDLVARRFLALFHPAAKIENTTVLTDVDGTDGTSYRFRSRGRIIAEPGWRAVYDTVPEADERASGRKTQDEEDEKDEGELPTELAVRAALACSGAEAEERKTKPPSAYTEATLLSAMETAGRLVDEEELREAMKDGGLGTPATRANIIETLLKREYIARQGKRLRATSKGTATIELLGENHPLASPELTGSWEARLHRVASGEEDRAAFMADITRLTGELTSGIATLTSQTLGAPPVANVCPCPRCGEAIRETAKTFMCSSWKSEDDAGCGFRIWKVVAKRRLTPDEARQLIETGHSEVLEGFVSKKGAAFAAALELKDDLTTSFAFAPRACR